MSAAIKVIVVSEVRLYREGISTALGDDERFVVAAGVRRLAEAVRSGEAERADVVLLDVSRIEDPVVIELLLRQIDTPILSLAVRESDAEVLTWARRGIAGILTLAASLDELGVAIVAAAASQGHCSPVATATLLRCVAAGGESAGRSEDARARLTAREREIGALLACGCSNKEIAARLYLGVSTVKNHVHNVLQKLDARSRADAAVRLVEAGI